MAALQVFNAKTPTQKSWSTIKIGSPCLTRANLCRARYSKKRLLRPRKLCQKWVSCLLVWLETMAQLLRLVFWRIDTRLSGKRKMDSKRQTSMDLSLSRPQLMSALNLTKRVASCRMFSSLSTNCFQWQILSTLRSVAGTSPT